MGSTTQLLVGNPLVLGPAPVPPGFGPGCDNTYGSLQEFDSYITPDGIEFKLHAPDVRAVLSDTGSGMPPIQYVTERGPFQHGVTLKDFFLQPRVIQMVVRQNFANRIKWYAGKASLVNALRPNRTPGNFSDSQQPKTGVLRKYMPDGSMLDLSVLISSGPKFEPRNLGQGWDEWSFQETLQFQAFNPVYFNPEARQETFTNNDSQLVFPATFPIQFGRLDVTATIDYVGTWEEFPSFVVNGPASSVSITNQTTGVSFQVNYNIPFGQQIIISLAYGNKSISLLDGTTINQFLTPNSDIVDWSLVPHPISANGVNVVHVIVQGAGASSNVIMTWHDRYIDLEPTNTALLVK